MNCRSCGESLQLNVIDLKTAPPSNSYLSRTQLSSPEMWFPLRVNVCESCWLVQTEDYARHDELFSSDYAYFSSVSTMWLNHAQAFVEKSITRFGLTRQSHVVEIASNDGYLLQHFVQRGIPCLGVEPTRSTANVARQRGIEVIEEFFGERLSVELRDRGRTADLVVANNVLAHVPNINDFVLGFANLLKIGGVATFEFPHLLALVIGCQFDTIYHEHFSYLSLTAVQSAFNRNGLDIFDVERLGTHGGSLRVYAQRADCRRIERSQSVADVLGEETAAGISGRPFYEGMQARAEKVKDGLVAFLLHAKASGKSVVGYGAAAKGNTLLNFAGVRSDWIPYVVDRSPAKQGKYLPGSRIPILGEDEIRVTRPDFVLVLPWNIREEVFSQLDYIRNWGGRFVCAIPEIQVS